MATQYLGTIDDNSFGGTLARSFMDQMEKQKKDKLALAQSLIQSGQYSPQVGGQQPNFGQRLLGGLMGPQVGGSNMNVMGQNYQQVTPEMKAAQLKKQMDAYSGLLGAGQGTPVSNPAQLDREISIDPSTGEAKIMLKSKSQDQGMGGLTDVGNKTPEQLRAELKEKNPSYAKYLENLASGKLNLGGRSTKAIEGIKKDLANLYPGMDIQQIDARKKTRTDFTTGTAAKNIKSLNTAVSHLSELNKIVPQLHNSGFKMWNQLGQTASRQFGGNPTLARFQAVKTALSGELATIYKNTGGTDPEIKHIMDSLDSVDSKEALQASIQEGMALMGGRMNALQDQWHNAFNRPEDTDFPVISSRSKSLLSGMGYDQTNNSTQSGETTTSSTVDYKNKYGLQ